MWSMFSARWASVGAHNSDAMRAVDAEAAGARKGFHELPYVEGKSFVIVERYANGDYKRIPSLIANLRGKQ